MKKLFSVFLIVFTIFISADMCAYSSENKDYDNIIKITKKMRRLSDKNKIDELMKFYSNDYKSFDGYNKNEMAEIFLMASKLYPESKTKETIKKIENDGDLIKVYMMENSKTKLDAKGQDAMYAINNKIKGLMESYADYCIIYKKDEEGFKVVGDEIYDETTSIKYGEALETNLELETPKNIKPNEEYTVKMSIDMPFNRFVVGSIGHDNIEYPPNKVPDPFRAINSTGVLERVMIANSKGKNEYANSSFVFFAPFTKKSKEASISGMGIYIKRINTAKEEKNEL